MPPLEYPKIETVFERGEDFLVDTARLRVEEVPQICKWLVTEKIDGTNIRISLEPEQVIRNRNGLPASVRKMTETEAAWVGAMIEGEGNVGLYARARAPSKGQWDFNVVNTDPELVSALIRATGVGTVTVHHPDTDAHQMVYKWSVNRINDMKAIAAQCQSFSQKVVPVLKAQGATELIEPSPWAVRFYARTNSGQIPTFLLSYLQDTFTVEKLQSLWRPEADGSLKPYPLCLYGEGYGERIQKGGGNYRSGVSFRLFDVLVADRWWLDWRNVVDVAAKLDIRWVPCLGTQPLDNIVSMVREGFPSVVSLEEAFAVKAKDKICEAEGVVARTEPYLYDKRGHPLKFKLKTVDFKGKGKS